MPWVSMSIWSFWRPTPPWVLQEHQQWPGERATEEAAWLLSHSCWYNAAGKTGTLEDRAKDPWKSSGLFHPVHEALPLHSSSKPKSQPVCKTIAFQIENKEL